MKISRPMIALLVLFLPILGVSQEIVRKTVSATRINETIKIDGVLDEPAYEKAEQATDFLQLMPFNGKPSFKPTNVRILYDDFAIYFGAVLYDDPDSIQNYITTRDNLGASDYFDVFIDPHNEGLNAYEFAVTPANSQTDLKATKQGGNDNEDSSWDAVWQSATKIHSEGWTVEMRIPYSALRFPDKEEQVWGLNFFRRIRRYNSNNSWNFVNFSISGFIQQSGQITGIKNIKPQVRLSLSPYAACYVEKQSQTKGINSNFKGGMDLKYGLSNSHTLDMMLIPDFGQIQSDDHQLNLSPYELYYSEKRQFFIEGSELFNRVGIFYSRRIGRQPLFHQIDQDQLNSHEKVSYNPTETQLVNATKISGRDKNGWGIGFLNAMSLPAHAEVCDTTTNQTRDIQTQPFTNYNVSVVEKALANNSYVSLINTNLTMIGHPYRANVTGTEFQLKNKSQTYQLTGGAALSYRSTADQKTGFAYGLGLKKIKGKFKFWGEQTSYSDTYNPNDMGYLKANNQMFNNLGVSYNKYEPFGIFKNMYGQLVFQNQYLFRPGHLIENQMNFWSEATFKNNWWTGIYFGHNFGRFDFDEPRVKNRYYKGPSWNSSEINLQSDQDKVLSFYLNSGFYLTDNPDDYGYWGNVSLWWKASRRFNMSYSLSSNQDRDNKGYVDHTHNDSIYFGNFDRHTLSQVLYLSYSFNTRVKLDFRCRHYWSWADYDRQYFLNNDGSLTMVNREGDADVNYNAFNIDMGFRWQFAPSSELSLVWKNSTEAENNLMNLSYGSNLKELFKETQINSLSLRVLYYIDYELIRKMRAGSSGRSAST